MNLAPSTQLNLKLLGNSWGEPTRAADAYQLPTSLQLAIMGINADFPHSRQCSMCGATRRGTQPIILPESSYV